MKEYWELFISFFRVGLFTFGGGYAMLPVLEREAVDKRQWVTQEELLDCYAIGQCTPGVIAVNTATYVGYRQKGWLGSVLATTAIVLPSLLIITVIALFLSNFAENQYVRYAFGGIRVAVAVLVLDAVIKLYKKGVKGAVGNTIFIAAILFSVLTPFSPAWIILAAIVIGIVSAWIGGRRK